MKTKFKLLGLAVLVTAIVFGFSACKNSTTPTPTPDPLNGTWLREGGDYKIIANNGNFEMQNLSYPDSNYEKGTYATSGNTITVTHVWGKYPPFVSMSPSLAAKWYTKTELKAADTTTFTDETLAEIFPPSGTYSVSGTTLTVTFGLLSVTYTKQ